MVIENNRFSPDEIRVKAGAPSMLIITNKDKAEQEFECEALKIERAIPPGKTARVRFQGLRAGIYDFIGENSGNTSDGKGRIIVE